MRIHILDLVPVNVVVSGLSGLGLVPRNAIYSRSTGQSLRMQNYYETSNIPFYAKFH